MRKIVSSILIFAIAVSILLTGCSDTPASGNNPNGTKNPSQNTTGSTENDEEAQKKAEEAKPFFQQVLESKFSMPSSFDGWHIIVNDCNGVQREHNKKLNNGLPILHKVPPKRDYGRYFCIMAEKGGTSHGGLTEKLSLFFHAKKQEVNAYGR